MKSALTAIFIGLFLLVCSGMAFADEPGSDVGKNAEPAPAAETAPVNVQPVYSQPASARQGITSTGYDWERDSKIYKGVGWGFFGGGMLLGLVLGPSLFIGGIAGGLKDWENDNWDRAGLAGFGLMIIGGAMVVTGIGVLIAEAVKFNPYRRGEIAGLKFEWNPELYVSPEFSGLGFSARF